MLWSALFCDQSAGAPANCVWTKQIAIPLRWIQAFLAGLEGMLTRTFDLDLYAGRGRRAQMVFDASPWGAGGVLLVNDKVIGWFTTPKL